MLCYTMPYHTILPLYNSCMHGMFKPLHAMLCFTLPYAHTTPINRACRYKSYHAVLHHEGWGVRKGVGNGSKAQARKIWGGSGRKG